LGESDLAGDEFDRWCKGKGSSYGRWHDWYRW